MSYPDPASRSAALWQRARAVLPGGNTRTTLYYAPYPVYAVRGDGARIVDADGVSRLDFVNNYTSLIHGHGYAPAVEAIRAQAPNLIAVGAPTESEIELAELLVARVPSLKQVRFCNSGSEAVMMAMKAARARTGRPKIAKIEGCYHGSYDYAEVSQLPKPKTWGDAARPASTATSVGTPQAVLDDTIVLPMNDLSAARAIIAAHADMLAGVIIDPLPSRLMFVEATPAFVQGVAEAARAVGALLIVDEVYTLRLSVEGRQPHLGVEADLVTMGKIIGGGLSIGAFGGTREAMSVFDQSEAPPKVQHAGTFNATPLAMAAGLAAMRGLDEARMAHVNALGERLREGLAKILRDANVGGTVLGAGSLATFLPGVEGPVETIRDIVREAKVYKLLARMHTELLNRGVFINPAVHYVASTAMTESDIDETLAATREALAAALA